MFLQTTFNSYKYETNTYVYMFWHKIDENAIMRTPAVPCRYILYNACFSSTLRANSESSGETALHGCAGTPAPSLFAYVIRNLSRLMTKPTNWSVRPAKTKINLSAQSDQSSQCAQWVAEDPMFLHADSEDWSDRVDSQADLSLRWAQKSFCWFCHEAAHLPCERTSKTTSSLFIKRYYHSAK